MPEYKVAKSPEKRSYKKLQSIELRPVKGENGGVIAEHHYQSDGMNYKAPETHIFGKDGMSASGEHLMEHISKHMKIPAAKGEEHEGPESEVESASEPATETVKA